MTKQELIETAKAMIAAPSCCQDLKTVAQAWIDAVGTAGEKAAGAEPARPAGKKRHRRRWWIPVAVGAAVLAVVALASFLILARVAPDFIDSLLYTPEQLRIINY